MTVSGLTDMNFSSVSLSNISWCIGVLPKIICVSGVE